MDLEEYWQENKRFVAQVAIGLVVFLIGLGVVGATVGAEKASAEASVARTRAQLRDSFFDRAAREQAEADNEALRAAVEVLREQVEFEPRAAFRGGADGGAVDTNRYLGVASRVRSELLPLASRRNVDVEETLGLPEQSPTRAEEIERYLDALDVIERVVRAAVDARVSRVAGIDVDLDPGLRGRKGVGTIERTTVTFEIHGDDLALQQLIAATQLDAPQPLVLDEVSLRRSRQEPEVVVLELTVLVARVQARVGEEEDPS